MANQSADGPMWCFKASATVPPASVPMQLLLDATGPAFDQVASLDATLLSRDPFPVVSGNDVFNPGFDRNTRVTVFVRNLQLGIDESASAVVVNLLDDNNQELDVPAEAVRPVASTDMVQVIFRLPGNLAFGACTVRIKLHGQMSNAGTMRIRI